jgi:hypothetical protein
MHGSKTKTTKAAQTIAVPHFIAFLFSHPKPPQSNAFESKVKRGVLCCGG